MLDGVLRYPKNAGTINNKSIMKKALTILGLTVVTALILVCCSGNDKVVLTVDKVSITGDAKDFMAVVPGTYEIKKSEGKFGEELTLSLKFKATNALDQSKIGEYTELESLRLQIIDVNGSPIDLNFSPSGVSDFDKIKSLLKGKVGDEVLLLFKSDEMGSTEELLAAVLKNGKGIEVISGDIVNLVKEPIIDNTASAEGSDCEEFYSYYEAFTNDYLDFIKKYKANPSDPTMISEYTDMATKAAEIQDDMAICTDPSYAPKFRKLSAKIAHAEY